MTAILSPTLLEDLLANDETLQELAAELARLEQKLEVPPPPITHWVERADCATTVGRIYLPEWRGQKWQFTATLCPSDGNVGNLEREIRTAREMLKKQNKRRQLLDLLEAFL